MKLKSDALEAWELEKWRNKRQADLWQRESKFKHGKAQVCASVWHYSKVEQLFTLNYPPQNTKVLHHIFRLVPLDAGATLNLTLEKKKLNGFGILPDANIGVHGQLNAFGF